MKQEGSGTYLLLVQAMDEAEITVGKVNLWLNPDIMRTWGVSFYYDFRSPYYFASKRLSVISSHDVEIVWKPVSIHAAQRLCLPTFKKSL